MTNTTLSHPSSSCKCEMSTRGWFTLSQHVTWKSFHPTPILSRDKSMWRRESAVAPRFSINTWTHQSPFSHSLLSHSPKTSFPIALQFFPCLIFSGDSRLGHGPGLKGFAPFIKRFYEYRDGSDHHLHSAQLSRVI